MDHLCFYMVIFFTGLFFANSQDPQINSTLGIIVGNLKNISLPGFNYTNVKEFLGIPFAKPPVGELRFRNPEPMESLPSSPFYAKKHSAICQQIPSVEIPFITDHKSEDCLYLNVYVPDRPADITPGHAVMIWVYGGGFQEGGATTYDFSLLSITSNIIVVTINYRVGVFGFLSTGDDNAQGNYGLWDQHLAFKWVHDNIEDFGGDNQRVTIAGESAGAMSVIQHGLIPDNRGYFQRIIAQSGSMSSPILHMDRDIFKDVQAIAYFLGCKTDPMDELMQCLREKSVDDYLSVLKELGNKVMFSPRVDEKLIKINPRYIAKMSESLDEVEFFRSLDILSGFNANEGASMLYYIINATHLETMQPTREQVKKELLPKLIKFIYGKDFADTLMHLVEAQYTDWTNPKDYKSIRLQIEKLMGDATFGVPAVEMARLHKVPSASRNFMYHFAPRPSYQPLPSPSWLPGAGHADEIPFVMGAFGLLGVGDENAWENELIIKMMTYWSNFVKSGDPNGPEPVYPSWPQYSTDNGDYLVLDKSMSDESAKQHFYAEEANFWLEVFPDIVDAVHDKEDCGDGIFTSAAPNVSVYRTVSLILAMVLSFATFL
ncbi:acetylcholinesterase-like [Mercenaria mercenaria]|uniref:acetylcholinesterase-like n=1 Tax=Mercenaria mercenaria TaxID=6596 RepID=UPI00234E3C80|nr:acetylcholinesterase-like [Mercenaria mercenaria]